jgi:hypothetical protein
MRPTGLGSGTYKKDADYSVFCGEWCIGRIYDNRTGPEDMRWFWALHAPSQQGTLRISNQVVTLEIAKVEAWAKLEEVSRRKNSRFKRRIKKPESTPIDIPNTGDGGPPRGCQCDGSPFLRMKYAPCCTPQAYGSRLGTLGHSERRWNTQSELKRKKATW